MNGLWGKIKAWIPRSGSRNDGVGWIQRSEPCLRAEAHRQAWDDGVGVDTVVFSVAKINQVCMRLNSKKNSIWQVGQAWRE